MLNRNQEPNKILPAGSFYNKIDSIENREKKCMYAQCSERPINSHTLPKNYFRKTGIPNSEFLIPQKSIASNFRNKEVVQTLNVDKFSAFNGFCAEHDHKLFKQIDEFDGEINIKKATLIHYRIICYGIHHIRTAILRLNFLARQNFTSNDEYLDKEYDYSKLVKKIKSKNSLFEKRLSFCLNEHIKRKIILEKIIRCEKSSLINEVNFYPINGNHENPIFFGRGNPITCKNEKIFDYPGYSCIPYISYTSLINENTNLLVFCYLEQDFKKNKSFLNFLGDPKKNNHLNEIAKIAYLYSDGVAIPRDKYYEYEELLKKAIKERIHG